MDNRDEVIFDELAEENINKKKPSRIDRILKFLDDKKWIVFIFILLLLFIVFCVDAFINRDKNDIQILYTGYEFVDDEKILELKKTCSYLSNDYNGDDILMVDFLSMIVDKKIDFEGNYTYDQTMITRFNTELNSSSSIIFIVENSYYEVLKNSGLLLPLSTIVNDIPEGAIDEYGILLGTLDISTQKGFKDLSPDSIICIRRPAKDNEIKYISEKQYDYNLDFFIRIINYKVEQ